MGLDHRNKKMKSFSLILISLFVIGSIYKSQGTLTGVFLIYFLQDGWLILKCKVDSPEISIFIFDNHNKEQGHCRPNPSPKCFNYYPRKSNISFSTATNVTTFKRKTSILEDIKGSWKCSHGSGEDNPSSTVEVEIGDERLVTRQKAVASKYNNSNQNTSTALCILSVAMVIGFGFNLKIVLRVCEVCRKITRTTFKDSNGCKCLRRNQRCIDLILNGAVETITECGTLSANSTYVVFRGIKLIVCVVFLLIPYLAVAAVDYYNSYITKETWTVIDVTLLIMGYSIGMLCAKVLDANRDKEEKVDPILDIYTDQDPNIGDNNENEKADKDELMNDDKTNMLKCHHEEEMKREVKDRNNENIDKIFPGY